MPFISDEDLLRGLPNCSPEFKLLTKWFYQTFNNRSAANREIINVEPIYYQGAVAGSEFTVYAATKLYLVHYVATTVAQGGVVVPGIQLFDEADAAIGTIGNCASYFDTVAVAQRSVANTLNLAPIYFSRLVGQGITGIIFIGYRITLA